MDLMNIRHKSILASQPHLATASGGTLVIDVGFPKIDSLSVEFSMEQLGSGTPSPSNVRPISGWNNVSVAFCKNNLFDGVFPTYDSETTTYRSIYVGNNTVTVTSNAPLAHGSSNYANLFALPGIATSGATTGAHGVYAGQSRTITPVNGYITIANRVWLGVDPTKYPLIISQTADAVIAGLDFGNTYYGGVAKIVDGELMVTRASIFDQPYTLTYSQQKNDWVQCYIKPSTLFAPGTFLRSDRFSTAAASGTVGKLSYYNGNIYFNAPASQFTSYNQAGAEAWFAAYKPQFISVYATPQAVQATPQAVTTVCGQQTVTSPAGDLTIGYWAHDDTVTVRSYSGIPVFMDNAYLAGAGTLGAYGTNRDWFIAGPFDTGTEAGKSITYTRSGVFPNGQTAVWRTYNNQTGGAYDYWAISDSSGSTPKTVTAAGRYVYASVKKSEASTAFMYQGSGSNVTYLYKGKNV